MPASLRAEDLIRLNSWSLSIASALTGFEPVPDGRGYRFRNKGSLKVNPDGSFFDFEAWRGGADALHLITHLLECDRATAIEWALEFLSANQGVGMLEDDGADATWDNEDIDIIRMQTIWGESGPIEGTKGIDYLQNARGIDWLKLTRAEREQFRWIENARGDEGAIVFPARDRTGEIVAIQLTYVTGAGRKSPHKVPRRTYRGRGDWRKHGLVRFDTGVGDTAYLTEGVEDALSLRMAGYERVFACLGVGGIGHAPLPPSIHHIVVVRDNDEPWSQSDKSLTRGLVRLFGQGLDVAVTPRPPELFPSDGEPLKDVNDVLRAHGIDGVRELVKRASLELGRIDPDPVLDELSRLDEAALGGGRKGVGKLLKMTQDDLKRAWSARRKQRAKEREEDGDEAEGHRGHVEPHPDPQDLRSILDDTVRLFNRHLSLPIGAAYYMALYAALSPLYRRFAHAPRTMFRSATPDSGKSIAASLLLACCQDGERTDNITPAALFRFYGGGRRCAVIDMTRVASEVLTHLWSRRLVAHNAAYELKFLAMEGIEPARIDCTMQAAGLLMGWKRRGLKTVAAEYLDLTISKKEQKSDWSAPHPAQPQINYAALDAVLALKLADVLFPALGRTRPAYEIQVGVLPAIARMELRGFGFNRAAHEALLAGLRSDWLRLQAAYGEACEGIGRPELKGKIPTTPKPRQALLRALLTREELASWPVTEAGELATDRADLRRALHYPPIAVVAKAGVVDKQLSAFGASLEVAAKAGDGRIRASYNCGATNSGRASCSGPNLQQIPRDKRFRRLFEAAPGHKLIEIDYRTMELRTLAHVSDDLALTTIFQNGGDPHTDLAIAMSGIRPENVSADEFDKLRTAAKAVNFGMSYGMGPSGLVRSAWANYGVVLSEAEAQHRIATFAARYPGVIEWRGQHANLCRERGYIRIGRDFARDVGRVHKFIWNKPGEQAFKFTQSCNLPIQGACADCAMLALTLIDKMQREAGIEGGPIAWLHDSIILEVVDADVGRAASLLEEAMIAAFSQTFPGAPTNNLLAVKIGNHWD